MIQKYIVPILVTFLVVATSFGAWVVLSQSGSSNVVKDIESYEDCVAAGYPVLESFPEQCNTPNGRNFVRELRDDEKSALEAPSESIDSEDIEVLYQGDGSTSTYLEAYPDMFYHIATTRDGLNTLLTELFGGQNTFIQVESVNFDTDMVVFVAAKTQSTQGYTLNIDSLSVQNGSLLVNSTLTKPGLNCSVATALSKPFQLIKVSRSNYDNVSFALSTISKNCT